jgi:hypothetical protein
MLKSDNRQIEKKTYCIFGIPFFSVKRTLDIDEFYDEITERFGEEMAKKISERCRKS